MRPNTTLQLQHHHHQTQQQQQQQQQQQTHKYCSQDQQNTAYKNSLGVYSAQGLQAQAPPPQPLNQHLQQHSTGFQQHQHHQHQHQQHLQHQQQHHQYPQHQHHSHPQHSHLQQHPHSQQIHSHGPQQTQGGTAPPPPLSTQSHHLWNNGSHLNPLCYPGHPQLSSASCQQQQHPAAGNPHNSHMILQQHNRAAYPARNFPQQAHHQNLAAGYVSNASQAAACNSSSSSSATVDRLPLGSQNYAKLPPLSMVNQQRINECAGIPLISTATAHLTPSQRQRISRKQSHSPPAKNWSSIQQGTPAYAAQLAVHAHGAPLLINSGNKQQQQQQCGNPSEYWCANNFSQYAAAKSLQHQRQDKSRTPLRYQSSAPAALTGTRSKENMEQQQKLCPKESDNSSNNTAGDSSNSTNETCLPRIIKPRKRRKKDRKPNSVVNAAVYLKMEGSKPSNLAENCRTTLTNLAALESTKETAEQHSLQQILKDACKSKASQALELFENAKQPENQQHLLQHHDAEDGAAICFCSECDPLKSIWDYPLRRSLSDSSSASSTSGTGSLSDNPSSSATSSSSSSLTGNDEFESNKNRADIVGVIGSKRQQQQKETDSNNSNTNAKFKLNSFDATSSYNNNILGGINLATDLFKNSSSCLSPTATATLSLLSNINNSNVLSLNKSELSHETAETLLTRSINEISKQLLETCCNEGDAASSTIAQSSLSACNSLSNFSTTSLESATTSSSSSSSSACSSCNNADYANDSGIESAHINVGDDLVFNFDHLHITSNNNNSNVAAANSTTCDSPTTKFTMQFLTNSGTNSNNSIPLTPNSSKGLKPTLDFLVDLNNNHLQLPQQQTLTTISNEINKIQQQQFNALLHQQHHHHHQQHQHQPTVQHDQQFFNNSFDLMWQQQQTKHIDQANNNNNNSSNHQQQLLTNSSSNSAAIIRQ